MTRKDYIALADAIREAREVALVQIDIIESNIRPTSARTGLETAISDVVREVARVLEADNPRFNFDRFVARVAQGGPQ